MGATMQYYKICFLHTINNAILYTAMNSTLSVQRGCSCTTAVIGGKKNKNQNHLN